MNKKRIFLYTYAGIMDIIIVYERILLYKPTIKFMRKTKAAKNSFYIFVFSIIINIPIILSRKIKKYEFQFEDRKLNVYEHQARYFFSYHFIIVFLANCVRDIIPLKC